jgi:hypothetical protein
MRNIVCTVQQVLNVFLLWIIIETDSLTLVRAMQSRDYDLAPEGYLLRDIRVFIQLNFINVSVVHVPRECNKVAHLLAAYGANQMANRLLWPECVPDDVTCDGGQRVG